MLHRAESEFDTVPFTPRPAGVYGRVAAAVITSGTYAPEAVSDLMIAATAIAQGLRLSTTNPNDFVGLETLTTIIAVPRPAAAN